MEDIQDQWANKDKDQHTVTAKEAVKKSFVNPYLTLALCKSLLLCENMGDVREVVDRALDLLVPDSQPKRMNNEQLMEALDNVNCPSIWSDKVEEGFDFNFWMFILQQESESGVKIVYQRPNMDSQVVDIYARDEDIKKAIMDFLREVYFEEDDASGF